MHQRADEARMAAHIGPSIQPVPHQPDGKQNQKDILIQVWARSKTPASQGTIVLQRTQTKEGMDMRTTLCHVAGVV